MSYSGLGVIVFSVIYQITGSSAYVRTSHECLKNGNLGREGVCMKLHMYRPYTPELFIYKL